MRKGRIAIVAVLAVTIAGAALGTAYARSGGGKQDRSPQPWNAPAAKSGGEKGVQWAVLNASGTTARHSKDWTSSADVNPPGGYGVSFKKSVLNCAYTATIGSVSPSGIPTEGWAFVAPYPGLANAVYIDTKALSGLFADLPVYLVVAC